MNWVTRWKYEISESPIRPGIYRLKSGGFLIRFKVTNPKTGKQVENSRVLRGASIQEAQRVLDDARLETKERLEGKTPSLLRWSEFAAQLFEEKVANGKIKTKSGRRLWEQTLRLYLVPAFGELFCAQMQNDDVQRWLNGTVRKWRLEGKETTFAKGRKRIVKVKPRTVNGWLRILRTICNAMTIRLKLESNPFEGTEFLAEGRVYTREKPNRVHVDVLPKFLRKVRQHYPQHYAMVVLGFLLGVRPSHMRPLRRSGPNADVLWSEGVLLIRRSSTDSKEIEDTTKTDLDQEIALPKGMLDILEWHVKTQLTTPRQKNSELLFPTPAGGLRTRQALKKPFDKVCSVLDIAATPRAMRRTFNNAARVSGMDSIVKRSISGHQTEEMELHYSHAEREEQRRGLERILGDMLAESSHPSSHP